MCGHVFANSVGCWFATAVVVGALAGAPGIASANIVVPNAFASVPAGAGNTSLTQTAGRTWQGVLAVSQLGTVNVGDQITGLYWRSNQGTTTNPASWPAAAATYGSFEIYMSTAVTTPATMSSTLANNEGADKTTVFSTQYTVPAGAYTHVGAATPDPWGILITFSQAFTYNGGGLCITVRHTGQNSGTTFAFEGTPGSGGGAGIDYAAKGGSTYTATTGTTSNFYTTQLQITQAPAPAASALLSLGAVSLLRRRERSRVG